MKFLLVAVLAVTASSCIDRMILDGTLKSNRDAASSFDSLTDLEVAKYGAASSLVQIEGMMKLAPDNEDGMFLLLQSWTGYAGAFIEDEWEQAYDRGDDDAEAYQANRAREAYDRAIASGVQLMEVRKPGFAAAQKNFDTMKAYLQSFGAKDAETLLWLGAAWLSRGGVASDRPEIVADLFVGVALVERSVELNDLLAYGLGNAILGGYHARAPDAELAQAKGLFEKSLAASGRKALTTQLLYAQNYACQSHDQALYRSLLEEVLKAGDAFPEQRLENRIAQRKAERYLKAPRLARCGFVSP